MLFHPAVYLRASYRAKPLLAGRIPDLQLNTLTIHLDGAYFKVDADGCNVTAWESIVSEA